MPDHADKLAETIRALLRQEIQRSPSVRALLVELANLVLAESAAHQPPAQAEPDQPAREMPGTPQTSSQTPEPPAQQHPAEPPAIAAPVPLVIGDASAEVLVTGKPEDIQRAAAARETESARPRHQEQTAPTPKPIDLARIEERARLKAESCRVFIERRKERSNPVREPVLKARMDAMIATAKGMTDCFLWVFWPHQDQPDDPTILQIARCYDALAEAAGLCNRAASRDARFTPAEVQQAFQLLAEASSALRVALAATWLTSDDTDQEETHIWLRRETMERGVFVERHMKLDDPASPDHADEIIAESRRLLGYEQERTRKDRKVEQLLNKAAYHARRIRNDALPSRYDFETINASMREISAAGVGPTDPRVAEFRETLRGVPFPDDLQPHDHLTYTPAAGTPATQPQQWSPRVEQARQLLRGGRIVIIGGEPRQEAIARVEQAFQATVEWVHLTEHGSGARMHAPIARRDTRVVILLIKLTGHLHADEAREHARAAGVPCVNIDAGYNPNTLAEQILQQAETRLRA